MRNGIPVIDADTHQMEPDNFWDNWIDPSFKEAAPRLQAVPSGGRRYTVEGEPFTKEHGNYAMTKEFVEASGEAAKRFRKAQATGFSPQSRLEDMDSEGVDVQIMYPTRGGQMLGREFRDTKLLAACCRAYNDWSRDYCMAAPNRLKWAAILPLQDTGAAITEAQRTGEMGASTFYARPQPVMGRNLSHPDYDPIWAVLEDMDKPLAIHDSASCHLPSFGDRMETHTAGHIISHPFEAMAAMTNLIWNGVFERFPRFTVIHVEADSGWLPYWLQRMEQHWQFSGNAEHPQLKSPPSEYFTRNMFVACRGDEATLRSVIELVGDDYLLINSDYPHPDSTWPWAYAALEAQPISKVSRRKILSGNAERAYRVNVR